MLEINLTLLVQIAAYFVLFYLLNVLLYKPVIEVLDRRKGRTKGALGEAADIEKQVEEGLDGYKKRLKEETVKAQEARASIKKEAVEKEKQILEQARQKTQNEISKMKAEIEKSSYAAGVKLKRDAAELSRYIAEKVLERRLSSVLIFLGLGLGTLLPALAFGSSGEEGGHDNSSTVWKIINFLILAGAAWYVWKRWLKEFLEGRGKTIRNAIDEAEKTKAEAEAKMSEYKEKLKLLDRKVEQIHTELRLEASEEKKHIIEEAEKSAARFGEQARRASEQEIKKAKVELKNEAARLAVEMAEEILKKELKPGDQKRLVTEFLGKVSLSS
jgi:F-type H+-transporting ATPase subunit b